MGYYQNSQTQTDHKEDNAGHKSVEVAQPAASMGPAVLAPATLTSQSVTNQLANSNNQLGTRQQMFAHATQMGNMHATQLAQTVQRKQQTNTPAGRPPLPNLTIIQADDILASENGPVPTAHQMASPAAPPNEVQQQEAMASPGVDAASTEGLPPESQEAIPDGGVESIQRQPDAIAEANGPAQEEEASPAPAPDIESESSNGASPSPSGGGGDVAPPPPGLLKPPPLPDLSTPSRFAPPQSSSADIGPRLKDMKDSLPKFDIDLDDNTQFKQTIEGQLPLKNDRLQESKALLEESKTGDPRAVLEKIMGASLDMPASTDSAPAAEVIQTQSTSPYGYAPPSGTGTSIAGVSLPDVDIDRHIGKISGAADTAITQYTAARANVQDTAGSLANIKQLAISFSNSATRHKDEKLGELATTAQQLGLPTINTAEEAEAKLGLSSDAKLAERDASSFWQTAANEVQQTNVTPAIQDVQGELADIRKGIADRLIQGPIMKGGMVVDHMTAQYQEMSHEMAASAIVDIANDRAALPEAWYYKLPDGDLNERRAGAMEIAASGVGEAFSKEFGYLAENLHRNVIGSYGDEQDDAGQKSTWYGELLKLATNEIDQQTSLMDDYAEDLPKSVVDNLYIDVFDVYCRSVIALHDLEDMAQTYLNLMLGKDADASPEEESPLESMLPSVEDFTTTITDVRDGAIDNLEASRDDVEAAMRAAVRLTAEEKGNPIPDDDKTAIEADLTDIKSGAETELGDQADNFSGLISQAGTKVIEGFSNTGILEPFKGVNNIKLWMDDNVTDFKTFTDGVKTNVNSYANTLQIDPSRVFEPFKSTVVKSIDDIIDGANTNLPNTMAKFILDAAPPRMASISGEAVEQAQDAAQKVKARIDQVGAAIAKILIGMIASAIIAAITLATAGAAGPLLTLLVGAGVGALVGAGGGVLGTLTSNAILGQPAGEGLGRAAVMGALTGMVTGLTAGTVGTIFGNSSATLTAWQYMAKESLDLGMGTVGNLFAEASVQAMFDGTVNWDKIGMDALIGLGLGAAGKGLTRAPTTMYKFLKGPSVYKAGSKTIGKLNTWQNKPKWDGSKFKDKVKEEMWKRAFPFWAGTGGKTFRGSIAGGAHKNIADIPLSLKQFNIARMTTQQKISFRKALNIKPGMFHKSPEIQEKLFKEAYGNLDRAGKKALFTHLPDDLQDSLLKQRKAEQFVTFFSENKYFEAFFIKDALKAAADKSKVYQGIKKPGDTPAEINPHQPEVPFEDDPIDFTGDNAIYDEADEDAEEPTPNIDDNYAIRQRYQQTILDYWEGTGRGQTGYTDDDSAEYNEQFPEDKRRRGYRERLLTTAADIRKANPEDQPWFRGDMHSYDSPQAYYQAMAKQARASAVREILTFIRLADVNHPAHNLYAREAERTQFVNRIKGDLRSEHEQVVDDIKALIDNMAVQPEAEQGTDDE